MPPRRRRGQPRSREALLDDPSLSFLRPPTAAARVHDLKPADVMTVRKDIHTDSQLQAGLRRKAALLGGVPYPSPAKTGEGRLAGLRANVGSPRDNPRSSPMTMPRVEVITSVERDAGGGRVRIRSAWSRRRSSLERRPRRLRDRQAFTSASSFDGARSCAIGSMPVHRNWSRSRSFLLLPCHPPLRLRRHRRLLADVAARAASSRSSLAADAASASIATWMPRRCGAFWTRSGPDDPMIPVPSGVRVWLATGHTDMRKGFPGLALVVQWCKRCRRLHHAAKHGVGLALTHHAAPPRPGRAGRTGRSAAAGISVFRGRDGRDRTDARPDGKG